MYACPSSRTDSSTFNKAGDREPFERKSQACQSYHRALERVAVFYYHFVIMIYGGLWRGVDSRLEGKCLQ